MKKIKIEPGPGIIYMKYEKPTLAGMEIPSSVAIEFGEVIAVGEGVKNWKPGDKLFVKSWATDIVNYEGIEYRFVNEATGGILAKLR